MDRPPTARMILLGTVVVALIALQVAAPEPESSRLFSEAFNAGHVPLYGLVALAILQLLRLRRGDSNGPRAQLYLQALALTIAAGLIAEGLQSIGARSLDRGDVARDGLGALAFLLAASPFDAKLTQAGIRVPRSAALLVAALLLAIAFVPVARTAVDLRRRDAAFPSICGFDASWETRFVVPYEADLQRTRPPEGWNREPTERVARVAFHDGASTGLSIQNLHRDWSGYSDLVFEAYSELSQPVQLVFSIHDIGHDMDSLDRLNKVLTIVPGANRISIPLREMQTAPRGRAMDLTRMCGLVLVADHPSEPFVLYLDSFRLQ